MALVGPRANLRRLKNITWRGGLKGLWRATGYSPTARTTPVALGQGCYISASETSNTRAHAKTHRYKVDPDCDISQSAESYTDMKFSELKARLLVAMLLQQRQIAFGNYFEPKDAADEAGLLYEPGQLRLCANDFRDRGLINDAFTMGGGPDGGLACMLTASGVEEAEKLEDQLISQSPDLTDSAPASDRIVKLDHNSTQHSETLASITKLIDLVEQDRSNDFEDKEQRVAELSATKTLLKADRVNISTFQALAYSALGYLASKFVDAPIGEAAQATWTAIKGLLGI